MKLITIISARSCAFAYNQLRNIPSFSSNYSRSQRFTRMSAHAPSQFVTDQEGLKWRLCAGAAVFNSKNEILIGERIGKPGSWQTPQGGVDGGDKPESVTDAAIRELYEEVGLEFGKHVLLERIENNDAIKCQYKTEGTGSWLEKQGFAGQELNWVIFRCASSELEQDPSAVCNLNGLNGEKPEFTSVRWAPLDWIVNNVWEKKKQPYEILQEACIPILKRWDERCSQDLDFEGRWTRDATRNVNVKEGLMARGLSEERATLKASEPYNQEWEKDASKPKEWTVKTYSDEFVTPRRVLKYPMGEFTEVYEGYVGGSTLFGGEEGELKRCCFYLANEDADAGIAHVTTTDSPRGLKEESMRYLKGGDMILKRYPNPFLHSCKTDESVSTEVFCRP